MRENVAKKVPKYTSAPVLSAWKVGRPNEIFKLSSKELKPEKKVSQTDSRGSIDSWNKICFYSYEFELDASQHWL